MTVEPIYTMGRIGDAHVAASAVVVGDVTLGRGASIWHHVTIRGDVAPIRVGDRVNVQDHSVLHCKKGVPLEIAADVAIGHHAVVHCRSVGSRTLIGIRSVVLDDAAVGEDCIVAAGAVVPPGTAIPPGSVVMGVPAKVVRSIRPEERRYIERVLTEYERLAERHAAGEFPPLGP